jgi:hypothetical protein
MKNKAAALIAGAFITLLSIGATSASAATEFGDNCAGNELTEAPPNTYFEITAFGNTLPITAPTNGVITKWKVNDSIPAAVSFTQTLKVLRLPAPTTAQIVGEATGSVVGGQNVFDARIPVQTGDRLGLFGSSEEFSGTPVGNLYCLVPGPENQIGAFLGGGGGPGATTPVVFIEAEARFPVAAVIEPDADNDGYGDETQDKCPQVASVQAPCPVVTLSTTSAAKKGLASILITASSQATVTVAGSVNLGKGKTAKLNGGTQVVAPGTIAKFTLVFPQKLKAKLKELPAKRSLTLAVTATAPNLVGPATTSSLKVKLKGQAKPKKHKQPKKH